MKRGILVMLKIKNLFIILMDILVLSALSVASAKEEGTQKSDFANTYFGTSELNDLINSLSDNDYKENPKLNEVISDLRLIVKESKNKSTILDVFS
jgi:uncharacterized protein YpmS